MGSSISVATNVVNQNSVNNVYQSSSSVCNATCSNTISDVNLNITNGSKVGNINFTQQCTANAVCTLRTTLATIATQQLQSEQAASSSGGGPCLGIYCINASTNITNQSLENSTTQVITNVCGADTRNIQSNINIGISGSTVGNVDFSQTGDATASCAINNSASATVNQSESSQQSATATTDSWGVILIIVIAVVLIILGTAYLNYEKKKGDQQVLINQNQATADVLKSRIQAQEQLKEAGLAYGVDTSTLGISSGINPGTFVSQTPPQVPSQPSATTAALTGLATSVVAAQLGVPNPAAVNPGANTKSLNPGANTKSVNPGANTKSVNSGANTKSVNSGANTVRTPSMRTPTTTTQTARSTPPAQSTTKSTQTTSIRTPTTTSSSTTRPSTTISSSTKNSGTTSTTTSVRTPVASAS